MQCSHAGRQAWQAGRHTLCFSVKQTQRQVIHLCTATNSTPLQCYPKKLPFFPQSSKMFTNIIPRMNYAGVMKYCSSTYMKSNYLSPDHNTARQMLAVTCQEGSSHAGSNLPLSRPCLQLNQSLRNRVFHLQSIWNWGNQPDVQSCLLKQSPCLGFGSWTDSQPCGMAAVEGLFKLHPG